MKRILIMALVASFVLSAGFASAKEMGFVGQFEHTIEWTDNTNLLDMDRDNTSEDDFAAHQRLRLYFQYIDSETLRGVVGFEIDTTWGLAGRGAHYGGGAVGTDGGIVETKHAYTDFAAGGVNFRVGLQPLAFPTAGIGTPIMDGDVAGIVASYQFNEMFGLTAGWARLWDANDNGFGGGTDSPGKNNSDEIDAFTVMAPITMDGWGLTPYVIYAAHGSNVTNGGVAGMSTLRSANASALNDDLDIWWAGAAFSIDMFDPFVFGADLIYGSVDGSNASNNDMEGWWFSSALTYNMDMVTPTLVFAWGSGEDDDPSDGSEMMPNLAGGQANRSGIYLTHLGFNGAAGTGTGDIVAQGRTDLWLVGLALDNFSFVEDLTHRFVIAYGAGTSDGDLVKNWGANLANSPVITDEDSFWEVNFNSTYSIYENLSLAGKFGYASVDRDEDVWGTAASDLEDALKFALTLRYNY